jgi:hypothetical protein
VPVGPSWPPGAACPYPASPPSAAASTRGSDIADETNARYYQRVCVAEQQKHHHDPREFQDNLI